MSERLSERTRDPLAGKRILVTGVSGWVAGPVAASLAAASSPNLRAYLHCSSTGVYEPAGHEPRSETLPVGDSHRSMPGMPTYSISKIAGEVLVGYQCKRLGLPTVIARLGVPYGDRYGWPLFHLMMIEQGIPVPVHVDQPTTYSPIHADDIVASLPYLLATGFTPSVSWCDGLRRLVETSRPDLLAPTS